MDIESNATTDNPNLFPDDDLILSGGNFHGQPLALGLDFLAIALAELGSISERRTFQLLSGANDHPLFLATKPGVESGLMITQYLAASIVSANKQLCTPASIDTIPSSNGQEDHVSMGANAATKCYRVAENIYRILAVELLAASTAISPAQLADLAPALRPIRALISSSSGASSGDRYLSPELLRLEQILRSNDPSAF
jgi:histidine ammonia-lyase